MTFLQKHKDTLKVQETETSSREEEFNSFQFWREPLPSIDSQLLDLLVSLTSTRSSTGSLLLSSLYSW